MSKNNRADLKWALGLNRLGAEFLGVWPSKRLSESNIKIKDPWHVKLRVPFIITLLVFWIWLPQTWALILVIDNMPLVIDNLMSNTAAFSGCFKLFFLWRNKEVIRPVVESAMNDWLQPTSLWERELMLRRASNMRLVTLVDYTVTALSLMGFIAFPLLDIDIRLMSNITDYGDRHLLVQSYYPFDYSKSPYFEVSLGLQYLGALFSALAITIPENYFGALVVHTSSQFEILGLKLERCFIRGQSSNEARLAVLVQRHVHLIALVRALEYSFTYITLVQMFGTLIILCSYGFQFLSVIGASNEQVPLLQIVALLSVMVTLMIHTLVDCVVGETLAMRSTSLIHSIYKCQWYTVDCKQARHLIPMMIMSRTQKQLTAGKILPLSLTTYCSILKSSAGYISMLIAVHAK